MSDSERDWTGLVILGVFILLVFGAGAGYNCIQRCNLNVTRNLTVMNYTNLHNTLTLYDDARVYNGIEVGATEFKEPSSQSATLVNRGMGVAYAYSDGSEEHLYTELRIPRKWDDTMNISIILIWGSPATSEDCDWEVYYLFRGFGEDMTVTTPDGTLQSYTSSSNTSNGLVHSVLTIPTVDFEDGDKKLIFEVWRDGDDVNDTLGDDAYLHAVLIRGVASKLGGSI